LTISKLKFLGAVLVEPTISKGMISDEEIESIGMGIINKPLEKLKVKEKIEVMRSVVPLEEWEDKGVKI